MKVVVAAVLQAMVFGGDIFGRLVFEGREWYSANAVTRSISSTLKGDEDICEDIIRDRGSLIAAKDLL